ncbi:MAG: hypothetical protein GX887_03460 [Firmicutes bacterium]|nr:hypothetical protein [Bacillota bacterium]
MSVENEKISKQVFFERFKAHGDSLQGMRLTSDHKQKSWSVLQDRKIFPPDSG